MSRYAAREARLLYRLRIYYGLMVMLTLGLLISGQLNFLPAFATLMLIRCFLPLGSGLLYLANLVTLLRALLMVAAPFFFAQPAVWVGVVSVAFALDAVDGWFARTYGCGPCGDHIDNEADGLMVLVLSSILVAEGVAPGWLLGLGLIRPVVQLFLCLLRRPPGQPLRHPLGKPVYGITVLVLLVGPWLPSVVPGWEVLMALNLVSFGMDIYRVSRSKPGAAMVSQAARRLS